MLSKIKSTFQEFRSEFKFNKNLTEMNLIGKVQPFKINNNLQSNAIIMRLDFQLKNSWKKGNNLEKMLQHMREIENDPKFVNFIQEIYGNKRKHCIQKIL